MNCHPKILDVVENDMCIACGACIPACPFDAVVPSYSEERGAHEVFVPNREHCVECPAPCDQVCPSVAVNYAAMQGIAESCPREGSIERCCLAYVEKHRDNGISSSGGIVRAFIEDSLTVGQPVVCLARAAHGGYEPALLTKPEELKRLPGSIYHGVSFVNALPLLQQSTKPCLLVSTPCQLEGIEKYIQVVDNGLADKIALKLGLICGWMYTDHSLKAFASYKSIGERIIDAQYRGEDQVGLLKIKTEQGDFAYNRRVFNDESEELDYRASFTSAMNRARCRACQNHVNVLADIAVGDAWLQRSQGVKRSIVVLRTASGVSAFARLCERFDVFVEEAVDSDLVESQSANLVESMEARELATYLTKTGSFAPSFSYNARLDDENSALTSFSERKFAEEWDLRRLIHGGKYFEHRRIYGKRRRRRLNRNRIRSLVSTVLKKLGLWGPLQKIRS